MDRKLHYLTRPYEAFRTAPLGASLMLMSIGEVAIGVDLVAESTTGRSLSEAIGVLALDAASGLCGAWLTRRQFRLRERLEDTLERREYDNRIFEPTTDEWCNRQTARVVLEGSDDFAAYEALCETRADDAQLTWLPHI